jgi:hypothetical protein
MHGLAKISEFSGLVHGALGPSESAPLGTTGLIWPHAIFRGVKRPLHDGLTNALGSDVLVYVTNPKNTYLWRRRREADVLVAEPSPRDSVFATYVSTDSAAVDAATNAMSRGPAEPVDGVVLFWEWIEAAADDKSLPAEHGSRYEERLL